MEPMTDLEAMLESLSISRRPGIYTFVTMQNPPEGLAVDAVINEDEGTTLVLDADTARSLGHPVTFEAAWLTLDVHSALEAVGLTAVFSAALAEAGIPCNVLAGFHHDHVLVPADRADEAIAAITARAGSRG